MTLLLLALLFLQQLETATPPDAPKRAIGSAVVILKGVITPAGRLDDISVVQGPPEFVQPSLQAMKDWAFTPSASPEQISVAFFYRARTLVADEPYEFDLKSDCCCALPTHIFDAGYPLDSIGEGSVVLQVGIDAQGAVERIRVVRPEPFLTAAAIAAVREWKFATNQPASAVVVISFLRPVLS